MIKTITNEKNSNGKWLNLDAAQDKLDTLFREMVDHNDSSELRVEVKPLKKGRKNVVVYSGKRYHFILKPVQKPVEDGNPGN